MVGWLDRLQRRNRAVGVIVAVIYKYNDDQGSYLAVLITYYALVSLFPLLLLLTTGLGIVLAGRPDPGLDHAARPRGPGHGLTSRAGGGAGHV